MVVQLVKKLFIKQEKPQKIIQKKKLKMKQRYQRKDIYPDKRQKIIDELRLV